MLAVCIRAGKVFVLPAISAVLSADGLGRHDFACSVFDQRSRGQVCDRTTLFRALRVHDDLATSGEALYWDGVGSCGMFHVEDLAVRDPM